MKVLVLSCNTGTGHNVAGAMLKQELEKRGHKCIIRDALEFKSKERSRSAAGLYNDMVSYVPHIFGFIYWLGQTWSKSGVLSPVYLANRDFADNMYEFMIKQKIDAVVAPHLFPMEGLWYIRKKYNPDIPFYGLQTDYEAIPFFHEPQMEGYFVPCKKVKDQMIAKGTKPSKIFITGIPVDGSFYKKTTKQNARKKLGIKESDKMYLIIPGGITPRYPVRLCRLLLKNIEPNAKIFLMAGNNEKLKNILRKKFGDNPALNIIDYVDCAKMCLYMISADVMLVKPGGLVSTEVNTIGSFIVFTMPIPGVEPINGQYFADKGMAIYAPKVKDAVVVANKIIDDKKTIRRMIDNQKKYMVTHSAKKVVDVLESQVKK